MSCTVVVVEAPVSRVLTSKLVEELRSRGHRVRVFSDAPAFFAGTGALHDADVLFALGSLKCDRKLLEHGAKLRAVVAPYTGTEGFDEAAATDLQIVIANGQAPENVNGMADATLLFMLASSLDLAGAQRQLSSGAGEREAHLLHGKTVGLLGFGRIAQAVQRRLAGWDVDVLVCAPRLPAPVPSGVRRVTIDEMIAESDIISIHAPLNAQTRGLFDRSRLAALKRNAILINTARGAIVDEEALVSVARERPDLRFALDTFAKEPLPAASPVRDLPSSILTPHCIGQTVEGAAALDELALDNVLAALEGRSPRCVRNPAVLPAWLRRWAAA